MAANIRHSAGTPEWSTADEIIAIARDVLGEIHFDPFSASEWNERVRAKRFGSLPGRGGDVIDATKSSWFPHTPRADFITAGILPSDILRAPDFVRSERYNAFMNPPGDDTGELVKRAYSLLEWHHRMEWIESAFYVGFSLNQLQTLQNISPLYGVKGRTPLGGSGFIRCIPRIRTAFVGHEGEGEQPSHPSFFMLMPSRFPSVRAEQVNRFMTLASELGDVF